MCNYEKCFVYAIINDVTDKFYVGSTKNSLQKRLINHKSLSKVSHNYPLYKHVQEVGGWKHFKIGILEILKCSSKGDLLKREQYYKDLLKHQLNKNNCYRTEEYKKEYAKKISKKYVQHKIKCMCGAISSKSNISHHVKSQKHMKFMKINNLN